MNTLELRTGSSDVKEVSIPICSSPLREERPRDGKTFSMQSLAFRTSVVRVVFELFVN
jgi:hypothetical protein